jgi:DNA replication and repair protein RecF
MYLTHLSLTNFRSFTRLDMEIPRRNLLLVGDNAQGKTSLLEAIYFLATFSSLHAEHDRQIINFLTLSDPLAVSRIVADYSTEDQHRRIEVRLVQENLSGFSTPRFRKEILVDGVKRTSHEALGNFLAVIFTPQMMRIIEESPEDRRRYLNLMLCQVIPGYARCLSEYSQAVTQRNALLKQLADRGTDPQQLDYWDTMIADRGARLIQVRIGAIQELELIAARIHRQLTESQEVLRLVYQPAYDPLPQVEKQLSLPLSTPISRTGYTYEMIRDGFITRLQNIRNEEIARGITTIGPHRDEMRFLSNEIDLGDYGSRGQVRTALLSLKLAECIWIQQKTGHKPVVLLDETLAELDDQRRVDLLTYLSTSEQALLTTTDLKLFSPEFIEKSTVWKVTKGYVHPIHE